MKKVFSLMTTGMFLVLFAICSATPVAIAQKQSSIPVSSVIADADSSGTPYQIQSDDQGPYTNSKLVQSVIQPVGDWVLDTNYSLLSTRGVYLDFSNGPCPWLDADRKCIPVTVKARLITQCAPYHKDSGDNMLSLKNDQTIACGLVIQFDYLDPTNNIINSYRLAMNPLGVNGYIETDTINISCLGVGTNSQCNHWSILPAGNLGSIAKLLQLTTVRGKTQATDLGDFYMSFSIDITN